MLTSLAEVAKQEGISLPADVADSIVEKSARNMRRALLMLEACHVAQYVEQEITHYCTFLVLCFCQDDLLELNICRCYYMHG